MANHKKHNAVDYILRCKLRAFIINKLFFQFTHYIMLCKNLSIARSLAIGRFLPSIHTGEISKHRDSYIAGYKPNPRSRSYQIAPVPRTAKRLLTYSIFDLLSMNRIDLFDKFYSHASTPNFWLQ